MITILGIIADISILLVSNTAEKGHFSQCSLQSWY